MFGWFMIYKYDFSFGIENIPGSGKGYTCIVEGGNRNRKSFENVKIMEKNSTGISCPRNALARYPYPKGFCTYAKRKRILMFRFRRPCDDRSTVIRTGFDVWKKKILKNTRNMNMLKKTCDTLERVQKVIFIKCTIAKVYLKITVRFRLSEC